MNLILNAGNALVAVLQAAGITAERSRIRPIAKGEATLVVVQPGKGRTSENSDLASGMPVTWNSLFNIECYARAQPGQPADEAVDPVASAVYQAVMADPTLGARVLWCEPLGYEFDLDGEVEPVVCVTFIFQIRQRCAGNHF